MPIVIDPPISPPLEPPKDDGSNLWELLYEAMGFYRKADAETGYHLRMACEAWCAPMQPAYDLLRERLDGTPPWGILFDADRCPAELLPLLALFVGATLTPQMDEAQRRAEIKAPTTWRRGQTETMKTALAATLTGTKYVVIKERTPEAPDLYVRVLASECPDGGRTEALAMSSKVAGLLMDFALFTDFTLNDLEAKYETAADAEEAYAVLDDAVTDTP